MGLKLLLAPTSLENLLRQAINELEPLARSRQVRFQLEADPLRPLRLDGEAITRLLENLLSNAIKFSYQDGQVSVRLYGDEKEQMIIVKDQGIGISPEVLPLIFQPFYRSPEALQAGVQGTGLGLYVAKLIAEAHGGTITVESRQGRGACVTVHLPLS